MCWVISLRATFSLVFVLRWKKEAFYANYYGEEFTYSDEAGGERPSRKCRAATSS